MSGDRRWRVLHLLSGCTVGGCEQHVLSLLARLDRTRYEPWLAYFEAEPDEAAPLAPRFRAAGVRTVDLGARRRADPRAVLRLGRLLRRGRFDLVHAHSLRTELAAVLWGRLLGRVPVVLRTVHNTDDFYVRPGYAALARASARHLDRLIVISDAVGRYLRDKAGLPGDKLVRIYYGLDVGSWEMGVGSRGPESPRPRLPSPNSQPRTIGIVARLAPQKGHRVLFDAQPAVLARVPDARVRVIGHEELSTVAELRAYAAERGVAERISFEGFRGDVPALLRELDVLALPSLWEGFGLVLLEAMAAGRPVVATAVGPIPEVVLDGETGLLVPPEDPAALAEALVRVLADPALAGRLGRAGRARVEQTFGVERMVAETDALYRELLEAKLPHPPAALEHVACPGCGADAPSRVAREGPLGIVRCGGCRLLYVTPRLVEPQAHYHGEREAVVRKYGPILRGERGHNRDPNYEQELAILRRAKPGGRLLDVGTHCGFFLRKARGMGWTLTGVEPSPIGAQLAREFYGLDVRTATLQEAAFPDRSFDLVTMVDVFEHVGEPRAVLAEVRRILRDDGLVFVKVPNGRYNLFKYRLFRRALGLRRVEIFDAKEHVVHYTAETLAATLGAGGFRVRFAFVPLPIQDGAWWKCALRSLAYRLARAHRALGGGFGPLATDIAVVAEKAPARGG